MQKHIKEAFEWGVEIIFLVSSGLKNEQCGADNNPYGTLRIVTKNKDELNNIYEMGCKILKENTSCDSKPSSDVKASPNPPSNIFPSRAHKIRKAYKRRGFVPRNIDFFRKDPSDDLDTAFQSLSVTSTTVTANSSPGSAILETQFNEFC